MPELSRFYGIVIRMYYDDHPPPHFHVEYNEHQAQIGIQNLAILNGDLPPRVIGLVAEWALLHQAELLARWQAAENHEELLRIAPLP